MSKNKKNKKKKKFNLTLIAIGGFIIFWLVAGLFLVFYKLPASDNIYVSDENAKQGDTVFVKVTSGAKEVSGNFGQEKLFFYKTGNQNEWVSFLGIDADQTPGDYKISVEAGGEHLEKNVKVSLAGFTNAPAVKAPAITKNGYTPSLAMNNIRAKDNPTLNKIVSNFTPVSYFSKPFVFPLSKIKTNGFSFGEFIGLGKSKIQHLGVDLRAIKDSKVYAVNDGKVVLTADLSNYGKTIVIDHGLGIFSLYLHLDGFKVAVGQMVKNGQVIGMSGETGYVTAPHLHFSMRVDGARVDPLGFITATKQLNENANLADISAAWWHNLLTK